MRTSYRHLPHGSSSLAPVSAKRPAPPHLTALAELLEPAADTEDFPALIGDVYDAALDASRWPAALDRAARFVGGTAAAIYSKDAARKSGEFHYDNGCCDAHCRRLYSETYVKLDPTTTGHVFAGIDEPMATDELIPYEQFVESRFYKEWARPQGMAYGVSTVLDKATAGAVLFGVFRRERDVGFDVGARRRMRLVAPHIRRAVLVGRTIGIERAEAATLADTMDGLSAGLFLVDASGRMLHANVAGRRIIARGDALRTLEGRLAANDTQADQLLRGAFASAGDAAFGAKGLDVSLTARGGERYAAHVLPLAGGERRRAGAGYAAACAVFVHKAELETPSPSGIIAKTFKLTPTELRVLLAVVEVGGAPEVADALGVAESTVKTHLGRLYGKTGTGRQADLVKVVAGYSSPLLS